MGLEKTLRGVDLRPQLAQVRDQGPRPTCLAFAITAAHEASRAVNDPPHMALSEEVLYWGGRAVRKEEGNDSGGITFSGAEKALVRWGQPESSHWPYDASRDENSVNYRPPDLALARAICFSARLPRVTLGLQTIIDHLDLGETVVAAVQMAEQFFYADRGWLEMPQPSQLIRDKHAVLVVGYTKTGAAPEDGYFIFRNSWGTEWGDDGYGYMPFSYLMIYACLACVVKPQEWP